MCRELREFFEPFATPRKAAAVREIRGKDRMVPS
jgi:hypothetical protein